VPWYKEAWGWIEAHPYWAGAGVFGVGAVVVLMWENFAPSPTSGLTFNQQLALQKAQYAGQAQLIHAQNEPALAQVSGQTAAADAAASSQDLATRLGYSASQTQSANALKVNTEQAQNQTHADNLQALISEIMGYDQVAMKNGGQPYFGPGDLFGDQGYGPWKL
jgi:hypothetical protein